MAMVNYYELLDVPQNAEEDTIKTAIRKTRKRFRQLEGAPDVNQRQLAETKMAQIAEAEKVLLDAAARRQYDQQLSQQSSQPETISPSQNGATSFLDDARSYYSNGQLRNASYASKEATRTEKGNPEAWYVRALISLEMNDYSDADFSANQALKLAPNSARIYGVLGDVADRESRYADAERYFNSAAQLEPDNYYWSGRVVWALGDQNRYNEALSLIKELYKKYPQEEYIKVTYINTLLNDIENAASHSNNGMYFYTNRKQIEYARNRMLEIRGLGVPSNNPDLVKNIEDHNNLIEQAARRKFIWQGVGYYVKLFVGWLILITIVGFMFSDVQVLSMLASLVVTVGMIWWAFEKTFPYQWKVNMRAAGADAKTGLQE